MFDPVVLTYGLTPPSLAARLGIAASLLLAALARIGVVGAAHLDGSDNELATYLAIERSSSAAGCRPGRPVIGALGVLADMGVTEASAVSDPPRHPTTPCANSSPGLPRRRHDLVATTHTLGSLTLGATLPLLLTLHASGAALVDVLITPIAELDPRHADRRHGATHLRAYYYRARRRRRRASHPARSTRKHRARTAARAQKAARAIGPCRRVSRRRPPASLRGHRQVAPAPGAPLAGIGRYAAGRSAASSSRDLQGG